MQVKSQPLPLPTAIDVNDELKNYRLDKTELLCTTSYYKHDHSIKHISC